MSEKQKSKLGRSDSEEDFLEFPNASDFSVATEFSDFALSGVNGMAEHLVVRPAEILEHLWNEDARCLPSADGGFTARQIMPLADDDLMAACLPVLAAHGWLLKSWQVSLSLISSVQEIEGEAYIKECQEHFGDDFDWIVVEGAAAHFAGPLSRLWYAANLLSLHLAHRDDLRVGFLWAEYRMRMRREADSLRGAFLVKAAREGGKARGKTLFAQSKAILASMDQYLSAGHSVSRAAELCYRSSLGQSQEANRKLWSRRTK